MLEWRVYRSDKKIEAEAEVEKIVGEEVPEGYMLEVTHMTIADATTAAQTLELGYVSMTEVDRVICINQTANLKGLRCMGVIYIQAGESPYGRVTTAVNGDDIYFSCHGKLWKIS